VQGRADEIILVTEDEPYVRQVSIDALRDLGYTVIAAAHGEEALRLLKEEPGVTLLFTDVVMPGMPGPTLGALARKLRPDLRLLYTSAYTPDRNDGWTIESAGAILPKPFTVAELAVKIRGVIDAE
jgi:CheY-like chemotaxis protein